SSACPLAEAAVAALLFIPLEEAAEFAALPAFDPSDALFWPHAAHKSTLAKHNRHTKARI
ncbi:MAG: hypothetical protein LC747_08750, partial [Acidobacteria bacterium]|nr:hypothetical protein [Acidobacteriota bacterium]